MIWLKFSSDFNNLVEKYSDAERIFAAQTEDGGFLHGGFGHTKSWDTRPYICISHVMTYALARFGYLDDPRLDRAYAQLASWQRLDGGWHPNKLNLPGNARALISLVLSKLNARSEKDR